MDQRRRYLAILLIFLLVFLHKNKGVVGNSTSSTITMNTTKPPKTGIPVDLTETCCEEERYCAAPNSTCLGCTCLCKQGFILSTDVTTLQVNSTLKKSCLKFIGKIPGGTCKHKIECVEGLICRAGQCSCPPPCRFDKKKVACDCGKKEVSIWGPVLVGICLGIIIAACWIAKIKRTIEFHMAERNRVRRIAEAEARVEISTLGAAYGTDHIMIQPRKPQQMPPPYENLVSPARNHQTVAPASPLMPAFNAYGESLGLPPQAYPSSTPPPPYPGVPINSITLTPPRRIQESNLNQPFSSMPEVMADRNHDNDDLKKESLPDSPAARFHKSVSQQAQWPSSAPGYRRQQRPDDIQRAPRSARF